MSQPDKDPEWLPPEAQNLSTQEKRFLNALKQKKAEIQDIPNPDEIENNDSFARLYIEAENAKTRRLQEQNFKGYPMVQSVLSCDLRVKSYEHFY